MGQNSKKNNERIAWQMHINTLCQAYLESFKNSLLGLMGVTLTNCSLEYSINSLKSKFEKGNDILENLWMRNFLATCFYTLCLNSLQSFKVS